MPPNRTGIFAEEPAPAPTPEPRLRSWLHDRPITSIAIGASIIILLGALILANRSGTASSGGTITWGTDNPLLEGVTLQNTRPSVNPLDVIRQQAQESFSFSPITSDEPSTEAVADIDFQTFLAQITRPTGSPAPTGIEEAYSYIPQGLISIPDTSLAASSAGGNELREYGNTMGSWIREFEDAHPDMPIRLRDHGEDRRNPAKAGVIRRIGEDYRALGAELAQMQSLPPEAETAHAAYTQSLIVLGDKLILIADTQDDASFLTAVEAYNASVEASSKRFQALSGVFTLKSISFTHTEPGSIFMFNPSLSLQ